MFPVAAMDDDLTEVRAGHHGWGVVISGAGRYGASRLGYSRLTGSVRPGLAMTVDADSTAELETCIKTQEEHGQA